MAGPWAASHRWRLLWVPEPVAGVRVGQLWEAVPQLLLEGQRLPPGLAVDAHIPVLVHHQEVTAPVHDTQVLHAAWLHGGCNAGQVHGVGSWGAQPTSGSCPPGVDTPAPQGPGSEATEAVSGKLADLLCACTPTSESSSRVSSSRGLANIRGASVALGSGCGLVLPDPGLGRSSLALQPAPTDPSRTGHGRAIGAFS